MPAYRIQTNKKSSNIDGTETACSINISVGNSSFEGQKLLSILRWCAKRYSKTCIFINDTLQRHNPNLNYDSSSQEGYNWLKRNQQTIHKILANTKKLGIIHWSRWLSDHNYISIHKNLKLLYAENKNFQAAVYMDVYKYITRNNLDKTNNDIFKSCTRYILEELAAYELQGDIYSFVNIHTGRTLESLKYFIRSDFFCNIKNRKYIYVTCRRKKSGY